ncbi:MAG: DinB family protein [Bacteroidetes bacterium]|nr:DinB family protein [Bacteroidota bacterium]
MDVQDHCTLFTFNRWANERTRRAVESLPEEALYTDLKNSFGSIHGTLLHLCGAEDIWLQRLTGADPGIFMKKEAYPTYAAVREKWLAVEQGWAEFIGTLSGEMLQKELVFHNLKGEKVSQLIGQSLQHLVNHSTYHRGQITTMVRQSGGTPVGTDLIVFYREQHKA